MVVEALTGLREYKMLEQLLVGVNNPLIMQVAFDWDWSPQFTLEPAYPKVP